LSTPPSHTLDHDILSHPLLFPQPFPVKRLCSLLGLVEGVLENVEGKFFTTPIKAALERGIIDRSEQQLKVIIKEQTTSCEQGAVGETVEWVEIGLGQL